MTEPRRRLLWPAAIVSPDQRQHHLSQLRGRSQRQRSADSAKLIRADSPVTSHGEHAMPRIIEVTVAPNGSTTIETKGYHASDCLEASKFLEQALGTITHEQRTSEFYQAVPAPQAEIRQ